MDACPGSCNYQYRQARKLHDAELAQHEKQVARIGQFGGLGALTLPLPPDPPRIEAWQGEPIWCSACTAKIRLELAQIESLASDLAGMPPGVRPASDSRRENIKVRTSRSAPSPSP